MVQADERWHKETGCGGKHSVMVHEDDIKARDEYDAWLAERPLDATLGG
jgi:heme/copper-type cytochrome/quinol oxidase subunit 2